jgi:2-oxoglutarate dehydrogenase E1 component
VKTLVFVTGKFYYDITAERENNGRTDVAVVRIEQLFPLPVEQMKRLSLYIQMMTMFGHKKSLKTWSVQLYVDELQLVKWRLASLKPTQPSVRKLYKSKTPSCRCY